jgi:aminoglycoside phosphotransferase (APT) family kinase protein
VVPRQTAEPHADDERLLISTALVRRLVDAEFPQWAELPVRQVAESGWDNATFRLGKQMTVRLPSAAAYAGQVEKEHLWLPRLAPLLPLAIPTPLAMGRPALGFPWKWSVYRWLKGATASHSRATDLSELATSLAHFLAALQRVDSARGPPPGLHNFHRGGPLTVYDSQTRKAIALLGGQIDAAAATRIWEAALTAAWRGSPVWIHGDVSAGNLLVQEGRLSSVIDFGMLAVGDPACDLSIAWTFFEGESRKVFQTMLALDAGTWTRGRGWALWKALIVAANLTETNAVETAQPFRVISEILASHAIGGV